MIAGRGWAVGRTFLFPDVRASRARTDRGEVTTRKRQLKTKQRRESIVLVQFSWWKLEMIYLCVCTCVFSGKGTLFQWALLKVSTRNSSVMRGLLF